VVPEQLPPALLRCGEADSRDLLVRIRVVAGQHDDRQRDPEAEIHHDEDQPDHAAPQTRLTLQSLARAPEPAADSDEHEREREHDPEGDEEDDREHGAGTISRGGHGCL
jgi:hypothetical protein